MRSDSIEQIYNFRQLGEIATAGQPTAPQFSSIAASGYQVAINLAMPDSTNAIPNERELVESEAMDYIHIPVVWEHPTIEDLEVFFAAIDANRDRQIFVHCAMNMRVSAFMYLYRRIRQSLNDRVAKADLTQIWTPNPIWQEFIDRASELKLITNS